MRIVSEWRRVALFDLPAARDMMYKTVYGLRQRRRYEVIDACLQAVDVGDFDVRFLLSLLTITASCADQLREYEGLLARVRARIASEGGSRVLTMGL